MNHFSTTCLQHDVALPELLATHGTGSYLTDRISVGLHGTFIRFKLEQLILQLHIPGRMDRHRGCAGQHVQTKLCIEITPGASSSSMQWRVEPACWVQDPAWLPCCRSMQMGTVGHCANVTC